MLYQTQQYIKNNSVRILNRASWHRVPLIRWGAWRHTPAGCDFETNDFIERMLDYWHCARKAYAFDISNISFRRRYVDSSQARSMSWFHYYNIFYTPVITGDDARHSGASYGLPNKCHELASIEPDYSTIILAIEMMPFDLERRISPLLADWSHAEAYRHGIIVSITR